MKKRVRKQATIPGLDEAPVLEELNLVEFPLAMLSDAAPNGQKTLETEDIIFDKGSGKYLERRCIVTGSDKWGLPNWFDIDVLLALMKLSNEQHGFRERAVTFSLYGLAKQLRLPVHDGRYSERLAKGLLRITGCTVAYINAWRQGSKWKSVEAFHLLDNLSLSNTKAWFDPDLEQHLKWNDRVVESIRAQHTKSLDWDFYIQLKRPTAKRLYRFLDKRWHLRHQWSWPLCEFCVNKLGMKPEQEAWVYRKNLKPGIAELVGTGVLRELAADEVFTRETNIAYVNFRRARNRRSARAVVQKDNVSGLERELLERGVSNAAELVAEHPAEKIQGQIENFDDRNAQGEEKQPGWLRRAIEEPKGFGFRKGFKSSAMKESEKQARKEKERRRVEEKRKQEQAREEEERRCKEGFAAFERARAVFPKEKQEKLEDDALEQVRSNEFLVRGFKRERKAGEVSMYHRMLWEGFILPDFADEVEHVWIPPEPDEDEEEELKEEESNEAAEFSNEDGAGPEQRR